MPPTKRKALHSRLLNALTELDPHAIDRLAYHAARAEDFDALFELAPKAALRASALGGHCEAETHYRIALEILERDNSVITDGSSNTSKHWSVPKIERAKMLQAWVAECQVLGRVDSKVETAI